ncbi:hypothetical protein KR093_011421 [Drosophila rubida]|uniref:Uncharacterized protein n=1 Tax=Drosophila rubida TaxID=30044 RepID=A0AAD4PQV1_9MUSC|nr:hypothetical protein KR093_011421 [Drosophila rubida]
MEADGTAATNNLSALEKSVKLCTAVLSDVDDISDIDIEDAAEELHKTMTAKPVYNERRSIFNTTLDLNEPRCLPACQALDDALAAYKEHVVQEKLVWETFTANNIKSSGKLKEASSASYKPSADQQAYLSKSPNLHGFIRGLGAFMDDSIKFLIEFEALQDIQESLKESCRYHVQHAQRKTIADCLARRSNK